MSEFDAFARYYDADYGAIDDDVAFYRELARRAGSRVLEAMCGTGRLLEPLASGGCRVTGVDVSPVLLEQAYARLEHAGLIERATLAEADVREKVPRGPFDLAIVALNSFMHLSTTEDQLAALRQLHGPLRPGGLLALDLFNPDLRALAQQNGELILDKAFQLDNGATVHKLVAQRADPAAQINYVTFIYDEIGAEGVVRRTALPFTMRWLYRYEIEHLLARAGFALEAVYGSYDLDPYTTDSELMLVVARKIQDIA